MRPWFYLRISFQGPFQPPADSGVVVLYQKSLAGINGAFKERSLDFDFLVFLAIISPKEMQEFALLAPRPTPFHVFPDTFMYDVKYCLYYCVNNRETNWQIPASSHRIDDYEPNDGCPESPTNNSDPGSL